MRFFGRPPMGALLAATLVVPAALVAPTLSAQPLPAPRPVTPDIQTLSLHGVDQSALRTSAPPSESGAVGRSKPVLLTKTLSTDGYRMLAVTWDADSARTASVNVRTHTNGTWSDWTAVDVMNDLGSGAPPNGRLGTEPYWAGNSDGVQVRVDALGHGAPTGVQVDLIEPGYSPADAAITDAPPAGTAFADDDQTNIVTRAEWGANESLRDKHMDMSKTVKVAFVHHTAGTNNYGPKEGPAVVRGLYSYYIFTLGYADIGYNFLVDKYGHVYEGRAGSITTPVRQAATGGFNKDTMAVVALGNFQTAKASDALVHGIARILAFRLSSYHLDPYGHQRLKAETGSTRYHPGEWANFKVISGHRDAGYTACPGQNLYNRLPDIRKAASRYMGANLVKPNVSDHLFAIGDKVEATVRSGVLEKQDWKLTVTRVCSGEVVRRVQGTATPQKPISTTWSGSDADGNRVSPGRYRLTLTSSSGNSQSWPWSTIVSVGVGGATGPPSTGHLPPVAAGSYVPISPKVVADTVTGVGVSHPMLLGPHSRVAVPVLGQGGVPTADVSAVAVSVVASCASEATDVRVSPRGSSAGTRVVSVDRNATARGLALVRVGRNGDLVFDNRAGSIGLNVSVVGYVSSATGGGSLVPLRRTTLHSAAPLTVSPQRTRVPVAGRAGVPDDARAVVLNVRRSGQSSVSTVWAWRSGWDRPVPSGWRRGVGGPAAGRIIVPIGADGTISVAADQRGEVSLDVVGYVAQKADRLLRPVVPTDLTSSGLRLKAGGTATVNVRGRSSIPTRARAVVMEVSGLDAQQDARMTVWARGTSRPTPSDLVIPKRTSRDTLVLVPIGKHGDVRIHADGGSVGVKIAALGWIS